MQVTRTIADCRRHRAELGRLALVPTMGALHAGHLALIELAKKHAAHVAVSIFVNPTQFGPREDFRKYPRPIDADLAKCENAGVALVFNPEVEEMYPGEGSGFRVQGSGAELEGNPERPPAAGPLPVSTAPTPAPTPAPARAASARTPAAQPPDVVIDVPALTTLLEGKHRPGHFKGVCQIVAKLFNIIRPDAAVFGQKDYQQLRVISAMTDALNWPVEIIPGETVRDADGLALSSRNQYLSTEDRKRALSIPRALELARQEIADGVRQTNRLVASMQRLLLEQHLSIDYVAAVDPHTLKNRDLLDGATLLAIAARVGDTRLIDNTLVEAPQ